MRIQCVKRAMRIQGGNPDMDSSWKSCFQRAKFPNVILIAARYAPFEVVINLFISYN